MYWNIYTPASALTPGALKVKNGTMRHQNKIYEAGVVSFRFRLLGYERPTVKKSPLIFKPFSSGGLKMKGFLFF